MPKIIERNVNTIVINEPKKIRYKMNDLSSVYTHYDYKTGRNVPTENKIKGDDDSE